MNQRDAVSREETMGKLTTKQRKRLPKYSFAEPGKRKYPISDKSHARNALARVSQHGTPAEKKEVAAKVHRKFPGITIKNGKGASGRTGKYTRGKRSKRKAEKGK